MQTAFGRDIVLQGQGRLDSLVQRLRRNLPDAEIMLLGVTSHAVSAMQRTKHDRIGWLQDCRVRDVLPCLASGPVEDQSLRVSPPPPTVSNGSCRGPTAQPCSEGWRRASGAGRSQHAARRLSRQLMVVTASPPFYSFPIDGPESGFESNACRRRNARAAGPQIRPSRETVTWLLR